MRTNRHAIARQPNDRAVSVMIIAVAMVFILAMAGLGVDLASLYVARSQAQRAADAAALAGAQALADPSSACVTGSGGGLSQACIALATERAKLVGNTNLIAGVSPNINEYGATDITFPSTSTSDPQVQVVAGRGTYNGVNHNNPLSTFFIKIFGIESANVSATAIAEAYNPTGTTGATIGSTCVKPWMLPNCDSTYTPYAGPTPCAGGYGPFVTSSGDLARKPEQNYPNGPLGEPLVLKPGTPGTAPAPGQFYAAYIPDSNSVPATCPSCAQGSTGAPGTGSGSLYRANIECCNTDPVVCGEYLILESSLQSSPGNMAGPTYSGVDCLIQQDTKASNGSSDCGQDYAQGTSNNCTDPPTGQIPPSLPVIPPTIIAGANNQLNPGGSSIPAASSNSVVVVPIFSGTVTSGQSSVPVTGFAQLLIRDVTPNGTSKGTVYAYILNVTGCSNAGGSGNGNPPPGGGIIAAGGSNIPVRLIRQ